MRRLAIALVVVAAVLSSACFQSETVIRVKADGTGTIEQTNLANKELLGMAAGMAKQAVQNAGGTGGVGSTSPNLDNIGDLFDEAKIREQASSFGSGVRYVSSAPLTQDGLSGVKATFAFDDVRLLNLSNPRGASSATPTPPLRFELVAADAGGSTLRVRLPQGRAATDDAVPPAAAETAAPKPDLPPEALAMVRNMFKGARMTVAIEVEGAIVTTDAPQRDGRRVTIFAVDFEQLLSDPSKFAALQSMKPGTDFATVRKALEGVPGVILPATPTVTIEFR
ncbi:MAG: hypothetical protein ABIT71_15140 [Vicinamibacteraceae bacterium]